MEVLLFLELFIFITYYYLNFLEKDYLSKVQNQQTNNLTNYLTNYSRNARNLIESPIKPGGIALVKILALSFYIAKWMTIIKYSDDFLYYFLSRIVFSDFAKEHNVLFRRVPTSC